MLGCGCTKNLIPNLLMLDAFQIRSPTPLVLTQNSNLLVICKFTIQVGSKTIQNCNERWQCSREVDSEGGQWCLRCSTNNNERGLHVWHERCNGGALRLRTSVGKNFMANVWHYFYDIFPLIQHSFMLVMLSILQ
jgi:hypothetical protein